MLHPPPQVQLFRQLGRHPFTWAPASQGPLHFFVVKPSTLTPCIYLACSPHTSSLVGLITETETENKAILNICKEPPAVRQDEGARREVLGEKQQCPASVRELAEQTPELQLQFYPFLAGEMDSSHLPSLWVSSPYLEGRDDNIRPCSEESCSKEKMS